MAVREPITKAEATRRALVRLGCVTEKPLPAGWAHKVVESLAKEGVSVQLPLVYKLKRDLVAKAKDNPVQYQEYKDTAEIVDVNTLLEVKELVNKLGGVQEVFKALEVLQRLQA